MDQKSLIAIRIIIAVRDHENRAMTGAELEQYFLLAFNMRLKPATGPLSGMPNGLTIIKELVALQVLNVQHSDQASFLSSKDFAQMVDIRGHNDFSRFIFTINYDNLGHVQSLFGLHSLKELELRSMGKMMSIRPLFGVPILSATQNYSNAVFVAMPFADEFKPVYEVAIDGALSKFEKMGIRAIRADDLFTRNSIMADVWNLIYSSYAVIADCTGRNANVFYELGMAHTVGKTCIILAQDEEDIPFDITHFRYIIYKNTPEGLKELKNSLAEIFLKIAKTDGLIPISTGRLSSL